MDSSNKHNNANNQDPNVDAINNNILKLIMENTSLKNPYKSNKSKNLLNTTNSDIYIIENGDTYRLSPETVRDYILNICQKINKTYLDENKITNNVYPKLKTMNTIKELEYQIVMCASEMVTDHYDYPSVATWILINDLHENTHDDYLKVIELMENNVNKKGKSAPIISKEFSDFTKKNIQEINNALRYERDYDISVFGYRTLEKSYLKKLVDGKIIERPQHLYMRVAIGIHYRTGLMDKIIETYDLLSRGYFTHATPTLFNAGTTREQLSSCFLLGINDDMEAIGECWKDCAIISKYAGGIAVHATNIRVDGAYIHSTQGYASGMRLLTVFNQIARYADQGGKRAGSIAIYIEPWHGDIFFFLDLKKNTGAETERARDLFLGLMINDIFMKRIKEDGMWSLMCPSECPDLLNKYGEEFTQIYERYESEGKFIKQFKARDVWFKIMEAQIETGVPYIVFKDAVNYKSNQINIGVVNGSNLCVSGDTMILTSDGYHNIQSIVNKKVNVWNGEEFSEVVVKKTGENQDLLEIKFSNGSIIKCTPYHNFYLKNGETMIKNNAKNLKIGDELIKTKYPTITTGSTDNNYQVPFNHNLEIKLEWLENQFKNNVRYSEDYFELYSGNLDFLNNIKFILQTIGCNPAIFGEKYYKIIIDSSDVYKLLKLGLKIPAINLNSVVNSVSTPTIIQVTSIKQLSKKEDTYCFTEPKRGMGIFNGIIAGNCTEIVEVSTADSYSICNLASIALPKFVNYTSDNKPYFNYDELYRIARIVTRNLDNIIDINFYPVERTATSNFENRPIGIGIQGLADVFAMFKTPFDSELARDLNKKIFETIYYGSVTESIELAKERGPYETFKGSPFSQGKFQFDLWGLDRSLLSGMWDWEAREKDMIEYGMRNSLLTTCMPTASTSQILANNECIEPYTENIYTRSTSAGEFYITNKHLMKDMKELGLWNDDIVDLIKYYQGSIADISGIPDDIKQIYRTVWEIPQKSLIEMAADRGPFIDQTQSMNIFIDKANFVKLNSCLFYGWKLGLKTGMYYLRSKAANKANQFGIDIDTIKEIEEKYKIAQNNAKSNFAYPKKSSKIDECEFCSS